MEYGEIHKKNENENKWWYSESKGESPNFFDK